MDKHFFLDEEATNQFLTGPPLLEWEGVVVMFIQSLLLPKISLLFWEKKGVGS